MKNMKLKFLSLGVLVAVATSATPVFAQTVTNTKGVKPAIHEDFYSNQSAATIIANGGVIQEGDSGQPVRDVQNRLADWGFLSRSDVDGQFGPKTRDAVRQFQLHWNVWARPNGQPTLAPDGIVGSQTWSFLS